MDIVRTSVGFAVVGDDGKVVSVHKDRDQALQAMVQHEYQGLGSGGSRTATAYQGPAQPSMTSAPIKVSAPAGFVPLQSQAPAQAKPQAQAGMPTMKWTDTPATQAALERSRGPLNAATEPVDVQPVQPVNVVSVPPVEMAGPTSPPSMKVHKRGADYQLMENGEEVGRFKDEDTALEHMNMRKYAYQKGIDLKSEVSPDAEPLPEMSKDSIGDVEEGWKQTKKLENPYADTTPETRYVGPYRTPK